MEDSRIKTSFEETEVQIEEENGLDDRTEELANNRNNEDIDDGAANSNCTDNPVPNVPKRQHLGPESSNGSTNANDQCPPHRRRYDVVDALGSLPPGNAQHVGNDQNENGYPQYEAKDAFDANPTESNTNGEASPVKIAKMPVAKDAEEYKMDHPKRGQAVIFNHVTFDSPSLHPRDGSEIDCQRLEATLGRLKYKVTRHNDLELGDIKKVLSEVAAEDHDDSDSLVVVILTHGAHGDWLHSKDGMFSVEKLWTPFTADKCLGLAGKPKLFFIQACRGDKLDPGVELRGGGGGTTEVDAGGAFSSYTIPTHADFLLAFSAVEGFYSWRNPSSGTWFIQCLCDELDSQAGKRDLLRMLTRVQRRVATDFQSNDPTIPWFHQQKQVPSIVSMLTREVYF